MFSGVCQIAVTFVRGQDDIDQEGERIQSLKEGVGANVSVIALDRLVNMSSSLTTVQDISSRGLQIREGA